MHKIILLLVVQIILACEYDGVLAVSRSGNVNTSTVECGVVPTSCPDTCYRSYDGSCNNLQWPYLGTPNTRYGRLLPPKYGDGYSSPTLAESGKPLPSARTVSATLYPDLPIADPVFNLNAMQFGQIITHDMSLQAGPFFFNCCIGAEAPEACLPIPVPDDDPDYASFGVNCLTFTRTTTDKDEGCIGDRPEVEQLTAVNNFLDLSLVYGNDDTNNQEIRSFVGGRLISVIKNGAEYLPLDSVADCIFFASNDVCYKAGDIRVNQNPQLTILHTLLMREHNRLADKLAELNPQWDDECIFQEARKINIAQYQHISYYEWLPIFIGKTNAYINRILYATTGHVDDYNPNIEPVILNEHANAAFRFFHSLIAGYLDLVTEKRTTTGNIRLGNYYNITHFLEEDDTFAKLTRGMCTQAQLASDVYHTVEFTVNAFKGPAADIGFDVKAIDIQRNRDHGLASYNDARQLCGLKKAKKFTDFLDVISAKNIAKLVSLYEQPDDVDLTVGGSLEYIIPGTLSGPTFLCILTKQFYITRVTDRFWFENSGNTGLTLPQLKQIRKSSISKIICDNSKSILGMQPRGFERISPLNVVLPCPLLPSIDLSLWKTSSGCSCASTASKSASTSASAPSTTTEDSTECNEEETTTEG